MFIQPLYEDLKNSAIFHIQPEGNKRSWEINNKNNDVYYSQYRNWIGLRHFF